MLPILRLLVDEVQFNLKLPGSFTLTCIDSHSYDIISERLCCLLRKYQPNRYKSDTKTLPCGRRTISGWKEYNAASCTSQRVLHIGMASEITVITTYYFSYFANKALIPDSVEGLRDTWECYWSCFLFVKCHFDVVMIIPEFKSKSGILIIDLRVCSKSFSNHFETIGNCQIGWYDVIFSACFSSFYRMNICAIFKHCVAYCYLKRALNV